MANISYRVRQIYYNKLFQARLDRGFTPYFNETADKYLENRVIANLYLSSDHKGHEYYGVLSWKFKQKRNKDSQTITQNLTGEHDVYSFFGDWQHKNVWIVGDTWHENFSLIGSKLFKRLGYSQDVTKLKTTPIYMNYWIAKTSVFERYCNKILLPAMEILDTDPELIELCEKDARYNNHNIANKELCMKIFGKPYYTYYPFVLERCMSTYIALEGLSFKHI